MPETRDKLRGATGSGNGSGPGSALSDALHGPAADRLKDEARAYLMAQAERALVGVGRKLGDATVKLNDMAEGRSPGLARVALEGGRKLASGKGPLRSAVEIGGSRVKDAVTDSVKGALDSARGGKGKKGGSGQKPTVILEYVDVGVPVREAYEQWTRFEEFATFTKGVQDATEVSDTESQWKLKIFWSSRSWTAHLTDQVPEERLAWTAEGAKGTTKGVVTFHPLGDRLTRVVLIIEYYPKGLFERTGNLWRAQGRRARLDLKHFARHVTLRSAASGDDQGDEDDRDDRDDRDGRDGHEGEDDRETRGDADDRDDGREARNSQDSEDAESEDEEGVEPEEDAEDVAYHEDDDTYADEPEDEYADEAEESEESDEEPEEDAGEPAAAYDERDDAPEDDQDDEGDVVDEAGEPEDVEDDVDDEGEDDEEYADDDVDAEEPAPARSRR
ncbi:SRPBCC family protein [Streptomyces longispororuber]|uniref:SRPBCC family protein n=1 Tax=Streptomyces longispororuber TaxID=68230 RepID=UPI003410F3F3